MNYLVVPSIRKENIETFLEAWKNLQGKCEFIVIEDNPRKTFNLPIEHHYAWQQIDDDLGEDSWIISRRDSAIRSYGFLKAYKLGAERIFTLDDDCMPETDDFFNKHIENLDKTPAWSSLIHGQRTRGIPYKNQGTLQNVMLNVGLWTGVPDYDGVQSLANGIPNNFRPPEIDFILPKFQHFPICGMNMCFKREIACLSYFPLMGQGSPFGRFDDIWYGLIVKKVCDHLDLLISAGRPFIHHSRASDAFNNLIKEAPGIKFNETFWETIDSIKLTGNTPLECMKEIGNGLKPIRGYYQLLGSAIEIWCKHFD